MRRKPFTPREHLVFGDELIEIENKLTAARSIIENAYGKRGGDHARRVVRHLSALRSWLDDQVCKELPPSMNDVEGVPITKVYYGWRDGPSLRSIAPVVNRRERLAEAAKHVFDGGNPWP